MLREPEDERAGDDSMGPFFKIFGSKHRLAASYPPPEHDDVIEPFAGAAGYATRHHARRVTLIEIEPRIAALWSYLIRVKASEIAALPLLGVDQTIDDLGPVAEEARTLVGFWLAVAQVRPARSPSAWMRSGRWPWAFWGAPARDRIASQVDRIRHWKVLHGAHEIAPPMRATWFVDPPYEIAGDVYNSGRPNFGDLARWIRERKGLVIACEADGAAWLPFVAHARQNALKGRAREVVYVQRDGREVAPDQLDLFTPR